MDRSFFTNLPRATKVLLGINILLYIITQGGSPLGNALGLHPLGSPNFQPHQLITHIFMHAGLYHLFFNMYALTMFGGMIEKRIGTVKFLLLYFLAAAGAVVCQVGATMLLGNQSYSIMVGASGAILGLLAAFAMLFPDMKLGLMFLPILLPAKYFMLIYMAIELTLGVSNFQRDNIAHFAHIGGAIVGALLILLWKKKI